jgi:hypothetical protein
MVGSAHPTMRRNALLWVTASPNSPVYHLIHLRPNPRYSFSPLPTHPPIHPPLTHLTYSPTSPTPPPHPLTHLTYLFPPHPPTETSHQWSFT